MWTFPHNEHPLPIAEAFDGVRWVVDLSYRWNEAHIDIESTARHHDLERARQHAFSNLKRLLA